MGYLVIGRKINERVLIGDNIEVMIADAKDGKVDLAIKAPPNLKITKIPTHIEEQKKRGVFKREFRNKT